MAGQRLALIVANDEYQDLALRKLRAPGQDADALARVLSDPEIGTFQVHTVLNRESHRIAEEIEGFFSERSRDDLLLLYFSCHGVKDEDGRLYFAASNTKLTRLAATAVSSLFVNEQMDRSRSRQVVLLLDCCYSGAFARLTAKAGTSVEVKERFQGNGRVVITASNAMEYAFEGPTLAMNAGAQSIFTSAIVEGLQTGEADRDRDGRISVDDLYDHVYERVHAATPNQTPAMFAQIQGSIYIARSAFAPIEGHPAPTSRHTQDGAVGADMPGGGGGPVHPEPGVLPGPLRALRRWSLRYPRRAVAVVLIAALCASAILARLVVGDFVGGPQWTRLQDLPTPLEAAGMEHFEGRVWVAGGVSPNEGRPKLDTVQVYDPQSRHWSYGPRLPVAVSHASLVSTGKQLFVLGGISAQGSEAGVHHLDTATGLWREDKPLPAARGAGAAVWDGNRLVFGGGVGQDHRASDDVWALENGDWHSIGRLQKPREKLAVATDGYGTVWFLAGRDPNIQSPIYGLVDVVQAANVHPGKAVTPLEAPAAVWWPGAGVCLIGGQANDGFSARVDCLDQKSGKRPYAPLAQPRAGLGATVLDGVVYVAGGYDSGNHGTPLSESYRAA